MKPAPISDEEAAEKHAYKNEPKIISFNASNGQINPLWEAQNDGFLAGASFKQAQLSERIGELERKLSLAGNACGVAATFLEFHGRPSKQLDECIKMMRSHEESALKQLDESKEIESTNKEK